jgi:membrane protease YdiL (CAAX protease family)
VGARTSGGHSDIADLVATLMQDLCFVGVALFFAQMVARPRPAQFGLRPTRFWRSVGLVVGGYVAFFLVTAAWVSALNLHEREDLPHKLGADNGPLALTAVVILVTVVAPICEEFLFRGYMYPALRRGVGVWGAAGVTGLLFGAVHAISSPAGFLVPLALFGIGLCLVYEWTGSLYPCIALHALNNSIAFGGSEHWRWWVVALVIAGALAAITSLLAVVRRVTRTA